MSLRSAGMRLRGAWYSTRAHGQQHEHHRHDVQADGLDPREELEHEVHDDDGPGDHAERFVGADHGHAPGAQAAQDDGRRLAGEAGHHQSEPQSVEGLMPAEQVVQEERERRPVEQEREPEEDDGGVCHGRGSVPGLTPEEPAAHRPPASPAPP